MASIHESRAVSVSTPAEVLAPLFLPLTTLTAGEILIPSQCTLTVTGTPSPLEVAIMLCQTGTVLGDPGTAVLAQSDIFSVTAGQPFALTGSVPPLPAGGVLGLSVPVAAMPAGAKVEGSVSLVR